MSDRQLLCPVHLRWHKSQCVTRVLGHLPPPEAFLALADRLFSSHQVFERDMGEVCPMRRVLWGSLL